MNERFDRLREKNKPANSLVIKTLPKKINTEEESVCVCGAGVIHETKKIKSAMMSVGGPGVQYNHLRRASGPPLGSRMIIIGII